MMGQINKEMNQLGYRRKITHSRFITATKARQLDRKFARPRERVRGIVCVVIMFSSIAQGLAREMNEHIFQGWLDNVHIDQACAIPTDVFHDAR